MTLLRRRLQARGEGDAGNAMVEFVILSVVLMMPLVYLMIGVFDTQRTSFGVTEAARQAGRAWIASGCDRGLAERAADLALKDQGVGVSDVSVPLRCPPKGGRDTVQVRGFVKLRGFGAVLPADRGGFWVSASFVAVRDRFAP
ncbi:MAG: hypothetical protein JWM64_2380 [Frankiales bacterium]|nr:hypothetical protein [Frankiales bacterium]